MTTRIRRTAVTLEASNMAFVDSVSFNSYRVHVTSHAPLHLDSSGNSGSCHRLALAFATAVGLASGVALSKTAVDQAWSSSNMADCVSTRPNRVQERRHGEDRRLSTDRKSHDYRNGDRLDANNSGPSGSPTYGHDAQAFGVKAESQGKSDGQGGPIGQSQAFGIKGKI